MTSRWIADFLIADGRLVRSEDGRRGHAYLWGDLGPGLDPAGLAYVVGSVRGDGERYVAVGMGPGDMIDDPRIEDLIREAFSDLRPLEVHLRGRS